MFVRNTIKLSTVEHEELTQRANRQSGRADESRRARLILLLGAGQTWASIGMKLDCTDSFIARQDKLYHIAPGEDGLFHCPFAQTDGCTHEPEELKCNYE